MADSNEAYVKAAAQALALPIASAHLPGVLRYFALAQMMADQVMGLSLTPADESGSVFVPVLPVGPEA